MNREAGTALEVNSSAIWCVLRRLEDLCGVKDLFDYMNNKISEYETVCT